MFSAEGISTIIPFLLSTSIPRLPLSLELTGDDCLSYHQIEDSLLMIEDECDDNIDNFLDLLEIEQVYSTYMLLFTRILLLLTVCRMIYLYLVILSRPKNHMKKVPCN